VLSVRGGRGPCVVYSAVIAAVGWWPHTQEEMPVREQPPGRDLYGLTSWAAVCRLFQRDGLPVSACAGHLYSPHPLTEGLWRRRGPADGSSARTHWRSRPTSPGWRCGLPGADRAHPRPM
jgi:hypothetical protein